MAPPSNVDGTVSISSLHLDVLLHHILSRLDGPTLAALSCTSSELNALSSYDKLWQQICTSTWPSVNHPLVTHAVSTFPSAHRSLFSDSYPLLLHRHSCHDLDRPFPATRELISAVDIYYQNVPIFSTVEATETVTGRFLSSPFRVDLVGPKEFIPTRIQQIGEKNSCLRQLQENITLSWILIDPQKKRAMNMSSQRAVSVRRHWLTGEVQVKFASILAGDGGMGSERESVQCEIVVTCGGDEGGEVHVRDVSMVMEDMEGKVLSGKESLVIVDGAMERGERRKEKSGEEGKERYNEFVERRRDRRERKHRREKVWDLVFIASGFSSLMAFCSFLLLS